jgi:hypothetical protein
MHETEQRIVGTLLQKALSQQFVVSVLDGEQWPLKRSGDFEAISAEVNATDVTELRFFRTVDDKQIRVGDVIFIHGNHDDVIHDHTDNETMEELCRQ